MIYLDVCVYVCIKQTDQILITSVSSDISHSYTFRILYSLSTADECVLLATNAGNFKAHGKMLEHLLYRC